MVKLEVRALFTIPFRLRVKIAASEEVDPVPANRPAAARLRAAAQNFVRTNFTISKVPSRTFEDHSTRAGSWLPKATHRGEVHGNTRLVSIGKDTDGAQYESPFFALGVSSSFFSIQSQIESIR